MEFGAWWREKITEGGENLLRGGEEGRRWRRVEEKRKRKGGQGRVKRGKREEREKMKKMKRGREKKKEDWKMGRPDQSGEGERVG